MMDKSVQSANFLMDGGTDLVKQNVATAVDLGGNVVQGDYLGAAVDGV